MIENGRSNDFVYDTIEFTFLFLTNFLNNFKIEFLIRNELVGGNILIYSVNLILFLFLMM